MTAPSSILLNGLTEMSIYEDRPVGSRIGTLSATAQSGRSIQSYALEENEFFELNQDREGSWSIYLRDGLDYETVAERIHQLHIIATDSEGEQSAPETITINVSNVNEAPYGVTLRKLDGSDLTEISEGLQAGDVIGILGASDPESSPLSFRLTDGSGNDWNSFRYEIAQGSGDYAGRTVLKLKTALDYEQSQIATPFNIVASDGRNLSDVHSFRLQLLNVDEAPLAVRVRVGDRMPSDTITVQENRHTAGEIGVLVATDPEDATGASFEIVDPQGRTLTNTPFEIVDGSGDTAGAKLLMLKPNMPLDREAYAGGSFNLNIKVTDNQGNWAIRQLKVVVGNINEQPYAINLSAATVAENAAAGTKIADLSALDPDFYEAFTFTLKDDAGGRFAIQGTRLVLAPGARIDFEAASSHLIKVEAKDAGGSKIEASFTIHVTDDASEPQTITGTSRNDILTGASGADTITGLAGDDNLAGGGGDDFLIGGAGEDVLSGGAGRDTFVFGKPLKTKVFDTILDFNPVDDVVAIDLSVIPKSKVTKTITKGKGLPKKFFSFGEPKDANDLLYYVKKSGILYFDRDGDGKHKAVEILKLKNKPVNFSVQDILIV
jgi:hypothetical protein